MTDTAIAALNLAVLPWWLGPLGLGAFRVRRALRLRSFGGVGGTDLA